MKELNAYIYYFENIGTSVKKMFSSLSGLSFFSAVSFFVTLTGIQKALWSLLIVFILDILTGCIASWIELKRSNATVPVYFIETKKLRMSVAKGISYLTIILLSWLFTVLFFDKKIDLFLSTKQFTFVELTIGVCIAIESWSNIENLKRSGFDIIGKFRELVKSIWSLNNLIKSGNENNNNNA